jgi:ectoine hydroxylase-related dioxygenase (phytanoyl-CoA dioxygenase family)
LRPHHHPGGNFFPLELVDYDIDSAPDEVTVDAQPGDLIAHHALTIHRSHANTSHRSRLALIADFVPEP